MTRELTIKIQLDDNAAYQAKTEALLPVLGLLLECDEKDISYAVEEVKLRRQDFMLTVKGRVLISADYEMTYNTFVESGTPEEKDHGQGVIDILSDFASETKITNGGYAEFSNISIATITSAELVKVEEA